MKQVRIVFRLVLPSILLLVLALPAIAQQGRQRSRVFTNEDVRSTAPAAPAVAPAAEQDKENAPAAEGAGALSKAAGSGGVIQDPDIELRAVLELQGVLKNAIQYYSEKAELETKPDLKARWQSMATNMTTVFLDAQRTINELQKQLKIEVEPAPPAP